ncbi:MAG: hypothetical protein O7D86_14970 [Proteobacteria bacterium]|nr:hypothetical protein [Pseudomonadota bacterium]
MPSVQCHDVNKVEIAAIDPDFQSRLLASVPDGISWQAPVTMSSFMLRVKSRFILPRSTLFCHHVMIA